MNRWIQSVTGFVNHTYTVIHANANPLNDSIVHFNLEEPTFLLREDKKKIPFKFIMKSSSEELCPNVRTIAFQVICFQLQREQADSFPPILALSHHGNL